MITLASSLAWKAIAALLLSVLPVTVQTNSGESVEGNLGGFTDSSLLISGTSGTRSEIPLVELRKLVPKDVDDATGPTFRVTLVSGSRIAAQDLSTRGNELVIEPRRQKPIQVPLRQVKAIRFRTGAPTTDAQWLGAFEREGAGDTLVIRRPNDRLDPQRGIVNSISDGFVAFDLDGDVVNAPIDRLEGLVFGNVTDTSGTAKVRVDDVYGSSWRILSIGPSMGDQPLQMRLSGGLVHEIPVHQIGSIQWSTGSASLTEMEPALTSFQPYIETKVSKELAAAFFKPTSHGEDDLVMYGGGAVEYRVEAGYQTFSGSVVRDPNITKAGLVTVRIEFDGKMVWQEKLSTAKPLGFELQVDDARRLAIKVDSENDGSVGDTVRILRPRLLK
ncbi:MAG: NPCBM/NEW2 domain-containing protein [Rubripirellula sp.]